MTTLQLRFYFNLDYRLHAIQAVVLHIFAGLPLAL